MNRWLDDRLLPVAGWLDPAIATRPVEGQAALKADALGLVLSTPLLLAGLIALGTILDSGVIRQHGLLLLGFAVVIWIIQQMPVFLLFEIGPGRHAQTVLTFESILVWAAALALGPTALIVVPILAALDVYRERGLWRRARTRSTLLRSLVFGLTIDVVGIGLGLMVYVALGGAFPFVGFGTQQVLAALAGVLVRFVLGLVTFLPFNLYIRHALTTIGRGPEVGQFLVTITLAALGSLLLAPFGLLGAGLISQFGLGVFGLYTAGLLALIALAWRLSSTFERSQRQAAQMARLDQLTRASVTAGPEMSALRELLSAHVPGILPPSGRIEIQLGDETILRFPAQSEPQSAAAWTWLLGQSQPALFRPRQARPWPVAPTDAGVLLAVPVLTGGGGTAQGGLMISAPSGLLDRDLPPLAQVRDFQPVAQSLAALIASMLERQAQEREAVLHRRRLHDLEVAGQIQSTLMPDRSPDLPGWQIVATLVSARETSGDFIDSVRVQSGRQLALIIADVADKGTGAALFMVLTRTLLRTYLETWPDQPAEVFAAVNRRLLTDTRAEVFVTAVLAVLDPLTGRMVYANAGHNPPLLLAGQAPARRWPKTGMPLGVLADARWRSETVTLEPGDALVMYTDGVTEAVDARQREYGEARLLAVLETQRSAPAGELRDHILADIRAFSGEVEQADDITLAVVRRLPQNQQPEGAVLRSASIADKS